MCVSRDFSRSQYSSLYRARSCEPTVLMRSIKLPPPSLIFSPYSFTEPQSHPSSIRTSILIESIDIKLSATSYSSAVPLVYPQLNSALPIYVFLANSLLIAIYRPQNPFYQLHTPLIDRLLLSSTDSFYRPQTPLIVRRLLLSSGYSSYRPDTPLIVRSAPQSSAELPNRPHNIPYYSAGRPYCHFSIQYKQLTLQANMAPSKAGFTYKRAPGHENDSDVSWCKYVCGFLQPGITNQDYSSWRNGMKRKMEQDRIPSWRQSTYTQWATIQAHSLTLAPVATPGGGRAALWQTDTV